jgi:hypothetical protein
VTGEVRFGQGDEAGHPAFAFELMPDAFVDCFQAKIVNDTRENSAKRRLITQYVSVASRSLDKPFRSNDHPVNLKEMYDQFRKKF